ncbi:MAG: hypothetical protein OCD01_04700 [Fibrobacterales bacterium]
MKTFVFLLLLTSSIHVAFANDIKENALSIHPALLGITSLMRSATEDEFSKNDPDNNYSLLLKFSYERSILEGEGALIVSPTISIAGWDHLGIAGGYRHYFSEKFEGTYVQPTLGYWTIEDDYDKITAIDAYVYLGYKGQGDLITMFIDIGVGYLNASAVNNYKVNSNMTEFTYSGIMIDANIGFGFGF